MMDKNFYARMIRDVNGIEEYNKAIIAVNLLLPLQYLGFDMELIQTNTVDGCIDSVSIADVIVSLAKDSLAQFYIDLSNAVAEFVRERLL